ncbi:MAG: transporter substrate-binding domain-containing protein [Clostridia bacterium]|nr:transporter substrate-binding domain-containing protein [Clostridia bacterium]
MSVKGKISSLKIYKKAMRIMSILLCLMLAVTLVPISATAEDVVKVGRYNTYDFVTGPNGERSGYSYDYMQEIAYYTGWTYEYIDGTWEELYNKMVAGEIDMLASATYRESRLDDILYSAKPMGVNGYYLVYSTSLSGVDGSALSFLDGAKLGFQDGSFQTTLWANYLEQMNIHVEMVPLTCTSEEAVQKIAFGEIDAFLTEGITKDYLTQGITVLKLSEESVYFAFSKNRPELKEQADAAMSKIQQLNPLFQDNLRSRYMSPIVNSMISAEQIKWITSHGPVSIGFLDGELTDYDPVTGEINGVLAEYMNFADDCLDNRTLEFKAVPFSTNEEMLEALGNGEIDMIFPLVRSLNFAEESGYMFSTQLVNVPMTAVTRQRDFNESEPQTVAIVEGDLTQKWYIGERYSNWTVREYKTYEDCEKALEDGQVNCFITNAYAVQDYLKIKKNYCIYLSEPESIAFMLRRDSITLLSVINQTIVMMPDSVMQGALTKFETPERSITFAEFVRENALSVILMVVIIFGLFITLTLMFLFKSRKEERKTAELNAQLQINQEKLTEALDSAEQANRAKTNFLFNMSHDIRTPMNAIMGYSQLMRKELTDPKLIDYQKKIEASGELLISIINHVLDMSRIDSGKTEIYEDVLDLSGIPEAIAGVFETEADKKNIEMSYTLNLKKQICLC